MFVTGIESISGRNVWVTGIEVSVVEMFGLQK